MDAFLGVIDAINSVLWHESVLYIILGTGLLFTVWSGFSQYRALTHGTVVISGRYSRKDDPGAISHFQALSAALSATVGLGNIGGVAVAVALGGPGAVFWMWIVGLVGMALKTTEVTLAMLYRNTDQPDNPHGGPMWVAKQGFAEYSPRLAGLGVAVGGLFCITLLISTITGGNMFQAWNVAIVTQTNFGVPQLATGAVLAVIVALVIIGGIKRIGRVAAALVPGMCVIYLLAALYVLAVHLGDIPGLFGLIIRSAFNPAEAQGAFVGGTMGYALLWGMKRALFSSEAGQGSSPIAHAAARTDQPVREGVVAGLEPFIDTLVVCTLTALVILASGAWNRGPEGRFAEPTQLIQAGANTNTWTLPRGPLPANQHNGWTTGADTVFVVVEAGENPNSGARQHRLFGSVAVENGTPIVTWGTLTATSQPVLREQAIYADYPGASLTSYAFDLVLSGLGKWIVTLAVWLFAISTMISWSYYGEQGMVYLLGERSVLPYKILYCILIVASCSGIITNDLALDQLTGLGTGVMLVVNIPIMLIFGRKAMRAYHDYIGRLRRGEFEGNTARAVVPRVEGH